MARKATLWTDTNSLKSSHPIRATLGDPFTCLPHSVLQLLHILELRLLRRYNSENHVLVSRQELKRLKAAGALSVVLEVVSIDVKVLEELLGDNVVGTASEMLPVDPISAAEVNADVHVFWTGGETVVVQLDVSIQESVRIFAVVLEALEHLWRAKVCLMSVHGKIRRWKEHTSHIRVIKLHIPTPSLIQYLQFLTIRLRNIRKILLIIGIHILWIRIACLVAEMVPVRSSKSELRSFLLLIVAGRMQVLELVDVGGALVLDFAHADYGFGGEFFGFFVEEGCDVWDWGKLAWERVVGGNTHRMGGRVLDLDHGFP